MVAEEAQGQVHAVFFPLMAHGHMIPTFDISRLFAAGGVKVTFITTPANAPIFTKALDQKGNNDSKALNIQLEIIRFPSEEVGLPAGFEAFEHITGDDVLQKFMEAVKRLEGPLELVLERLRPRPNCLVSDLFMPWTADVAAKLRIPRLVFHGSGFFPMSVSDAFRQHRPHLGVESEDEEFVVPGLPGEVRMTRSRLSSEWKNGDLDKNAIVKLVDGAFEAEKNSYGVIMNSFYELEPDYAEHYRKVMGRRAWSIGPVSLCNRKLEDQAIRGKKAAIDEHECVRWLDSKPTNSVIYISFGSITNICSAQLHEIAMALEASDQHFIWVVRRPSDIEPDNEKEQWLPSGFEARNQDKGLVVRGWAPQVMILDHRATGGFMTHCGWNSTLEGITAGVSMVAWPLFAEQFINEKLITEMLKIGVSVGAKKYWDRFVAEAYVGRDKIEEAVRRVMVGEEAEEMRKRAGKVKEMAWKAVEEGGSSYSGLGNLLTELGSFRACDEY